VSGLASGYKAVGESLAGQTMLEIGKASLGDLAGEAAGAGGGFLADALDIFLNDEASDNEWFAQNGHDGDSPHTRWFFRLKIGLNLAGAAATVATSATGLGAVVKGGQGLESYMQWSRLASLAEQLIPPSRRAKAAVREGWVPGWRRQTKKAVPGGSLEAILYHVIKMKKLSVGANVGGAALSAGGWLAAYVGTWVADAVTAVATSRLAKWYEPTSQALAKVLHWQAYREPTLNNLLGASFARTAGGRPLSDVVARLSTDPATRIVQTIWDITARTLGVGFGVGSVVKEPKGWLVLADVINRV
jgi:hypothetical protein